MRFLPQIGIFIIIISILLNDNLGGIFRYGIPIIFLLIYTGYYLILQYQSGKLKNDKGKNIFQYEVSINNIKIQGPIVSSFRSSMIPHYIVKIFFYNQCNRLDFYKFTLLEEIIPEKIVKLINNSNENDHNLIIKDRILYEFDNKLVIKEWKTNSLRVYIDSPLNKYYGNKNSLNKIRNNEIIIKICVGCILLIIIGITYWLLGIDLS